MGFAKKHVMTTWARIFERVLKIYRVYVYWKCKFEFKVEKSTKFRCDHFQIFGWYWQKIVIFLKMWKKICKSFLFPRHAEAEKYHFSRGKSKILNFPNEIFLKFSTFSGHFVGKQATKWLILERSQIVCNSFVKYQTLRICMCVTLNTQELLIQSSETLTVQHLSLDLKTIFFFLNFGLQWILIIGRKMYKNGHFCRKVKSKPTSVFDIAQIMYFSGPLRAVNGTLSLKVDQKWAYSVKLVENTSIIIVDWLCLSKVNCGISW